MTTIMKPARPSTLIWIIIVSNKGLGMGLLRKTGARRCHDSTEVIMERLHNRLELSKAEKLNRPLEVKYALLSIVVLVLAWFEFSVQAIPIQDRQEIATGSDQLVLEVTKSYSGVVRAPNDFIYFRLYQSGRIEFERLSSFNAERKLVKYEFTLTPREVEEILRLAEQPDLLNAKGYYPAIALFTDMTTKTVITYKRNELSKRITIMNFKPGLPESESVYPRSLRKLMQKIDELRTRN